MKAILFDFDGVLVQSMEDHFRGWQKALKRHGIELTPDELYMMEGQGVKGVANEIGRKYHLSVEATGEILKDKQKYYDKIKKLRHYPNLLDVLSWAADKDLKLGIVTGGTRLRVLEALDSFGIQEYFQTIVTSEDVSETKPSPQPYLLAANQLNIEVGDCIVIENAPLGIRSGKAAGMRVIGITTTLNSHQLREADVVVRNFTDLLRTLKKLY
jgi:beta-phosphoglucomutase